MHVPGCPDPACSTASIERVRMVLIDSRARSASRSGSATKGALMDLSLCLAGRDFSKPAQVPLGGTELGRQERLDQVPCHRGAHSAAAETDHVDVVVLHALRGGKVIMDQRGADTRYFVGANGRPDTAAAKGHATLHLPGGN